MISSYNKGEYAEGYTCNKCDRSSRDGHLSIERWFSKKSHENYCFDCYPRIDLVPPNINPKLNIIQAKVYTQTHTCI